MRKLSFFLAGFIASAVISSAMFPLARADGSVGRLGKLGGVQGRYSDWIDEILTSGAYEKLATDPTPVTAPAEPVHVTCLETPDHPFYIGVVQNMMIQAPLGRVQSVVEDFGSYAELFPGYKAIRVDSREGNRLVTYWENKVPLFFIPNVKYRMIYLLDTAVPDKKIYRYQLEKKGSLIESDGFIVLKKISETETHYLELDFFDADWGILKSIAPERLWPESVDALYESDLGFLLKSEHPDWPNERCRDQALDTVGRMQKKKPGLRCAAALYKDWSQAFPGVPIPSTMPKAGAQQNAK